MIQSTTTDISIESKQFYKDLLKLSVSGFSTGAWFPVGPLSSMEKIFPFNIEIAGEKLVVWNNPVEINSPTKGWSVMRDICPHRLAPLSQGRVDPLTGCIECPYHGWQFNTTGQCTKVPQLEPELQYKLTSQKASADALPVYLTNDLLWAFAPLPAGPASYYPELPDELYENLVDPPYVSLVRELPYSFDFLVENFFDVAHIPFAHHSLQSLRSDGKPMEVVDKSTDQLCKVDFVDQVRGKRRESSMMFRAPGYYTLGSTGKKNLFIFCSPVSPGRSRILLNVYPFKSSKLMSLFPKWIGHVFSNVFLDSDLWIHDQELAARGVDPSRHFDTSKSDISTPQSSSSDISIEREENMSSSPNTPKTPVNGLRIRGLEPFKPKYVLLSKSADVGVSAWRNWWKKHGMAASSVFGAAKNLLPLSSQQQSDRYEGHVKYCTSCQGALKGLESFKRWGILFALLPIALTRNVWIRLLGIISYLLTEILCKKMIESLVGNVRGARLSTAQFAP